MPTGTASKGSRTKLKVIDIAIRLAAKHGFGETSFQMIADKLGLSQSAVMHHFSSKNALFEEMVRTIIRHNHEIVSELIDIHDNAGRRLLKHCLGNIMWTLRYKQSDGPLLILLYYLACHEKNFSTIFDQMINTGRERLMTHLLAGQREGLFRINDPRVTAEILQDSLFGSMLYGASSPQKHPTPAEMEAKWRQAIPALTGWTEPDPSPLITTTERTPPETT
ncbi:MAG: hypothetical protein A2234_05675 [Elusimicrobia bacterium RIFOXYA2_FULL_58_8]|nr:MAG: hypothetical protein A2234_05675 [Elusimicrobia bacterium RIFOXYA2_FULL_58_8]